MPALECASLVVSIPYRWAGELSTGRKYPKRIRCLKDKKYTRRPENKTDSPGREAVYPGGAKGVAGQVNTRHPPAGSHSMSARELLLLFAGNGHREGHCSEFGV